MADPVLETERLVLRPVGPVDAGVLRQLWSERDLRVPPHRRLSASGRPTVTDLVEQLSHRRRGPTGLLAVRRRVADDVIGYCGLVDGPGGEPELVIELLRAVHGEGFAGEASRAVLDRAEAQGLDRVIATAWSWNAAALGLLASLGFSEVGVHGVTSEHGRTLVLARQA